MLCIIVGMKACVYLFTTFPVLHWQSVWLEHALLVLSFGNVLWDRVQCQCDSYFDMFSHQWPHWPLCQWHFTFRGLTSVRWLAGFSQTFICQYNTFLHLIFMYCSTKKEIELTSNINVFLNIQYLSMQKYLTVYSVLHSVLKG